MLSPTPAIDRPRLHPGTEYLIAPRVPHGLAAVVEGLTREVLRHRPEDIYVFAAHHFENLLKLREQYHADEYSGREFSHGYDREFNLWSTKETRDIKKCSNSSWSFEKEVEILESHRKVPADAGESQEDVSTDRENRKASRQTCSKGPSTTKRVSKRSKDNGTSDARATRIISQMSALHGPGKSIQTKDIKQELRKNKLSGEKAKAADGTEKGIRGERRSKSKVSKSDKKPEEEERATTTTTTTSSSRTSTRRPLKKVRRIETESETETERETTAKTGPENEYERSSIKGDDASREAFARTGSRERRSEAWLSEHSSGRKVSSRALSMDRIRAYVLRKFASTASLEVLRSPTYVEQVQEVIDRAAPIIKEKLEEIRRPRGKRSRSVDLAWNGESFRQHVRDSRRHDEEAELEGALGKDETVLRAEKDEKRARRRSAGSGRRSRRRESGSRDSEVDQVDSNSKHSDKSEHEAGATRDTLEARLTATQNILEGISRSTELGGARRSDPTAGSELSESEVSDHANVVSLPVVRPPSSRNSRSTTKNGSDNLTLPPISPEAPKSTKKRDDLSLPVLPSAANGNHSAKKSQEQEDVSKDVDEASTTRDITSDIEDIAILPEDPIVDAKQDPCGNQQDSMSDARIVDEEKQGRDEHPEEFPQEGVLEKLAEKRGSLEEFEELEELEKERAEEVFKDSLNVTPEVADVPPRPDSLEPDEEEKLQDDDADLARDNASDGLKDRLIEIEMAERSIEKALAGQQVATHDGGEVTSQAEKPMTDGKINEAGKSANEAEEIVSEIEKSTDAGKISMDRDSEGQTKDDDEERRKSSEMEKIKDIEISTNKTENSSNKIEMSIDKIEEEVKNKAELLMNETENLNTTEKSRTEIEQMENKIQTSINKTENLTNETGKSANKIEKSTSKTNEIVIIKNEEKIVNQAEMLTKIVEEAVKMNEGKKSTDKTERSANDKLLNGVEELAVKIHVNDLQSINPRSRCKNDQITEIVVCETDDDNTTASNSKAENAPSESSKAATAGVAASEIPTANPPDKNNTSKTKERRKREINKLPVTKSLSLDIPFSYVLSEGSPCEIPDSVTTVIIPDRPCPSPVIEETQLGSFNKEQESIVYSEKKDEAQNNDRSVYGMEAFGEYIRPEVTVPVDVDFMRGMKGMKAGQDIIIAHQDLGRIKEEGEEEEEKEDDERKEADSQEENKNDEQAVAQDKETARLTGTLEDIAEHENEENEETVARAVSGSKDAEEISSSGVRRESLLDTTELTADAGSAEEGRADVAAECKSTLENSSEESTQDTRTPTSSDVKESTASNPASAESPSPGRPVVPELNLDSLQDNTVSSFKMTANGTLTKEDNGSAGESDTTMSLIEPLTSDERMMNRLISADREEDLVAEELTASLLRELQSEEQAAQLPEADQLYREEHAEHEWLGKDPLEANLEDEVKPQDDGIDLKALPEDVAQADRLSREKEEEEELGSEEEIARELIGSLDKDMQLCAEELKNSKEESKESAEFVESNLSANAKSNQVLSESVHAVAIDEPEKREVSSERINSLDEKDARAEAINELSSYKADIGQNNKDKDTAMINNKAEESKLEQEKKENIETGQVAPLAQFEQDELLERNGRSETVDEKITVENKPDSTDLTDNQEKSENEKINVEVLESQSNENINKIEELNIKHEENQQEKLQDQKECEQKTLEVQEERQQEKLNNQEDHKEKSQVHEERQQEKSEAQEEREQEKLEIQERSNEESLKLQEEIVDVKAGSLEATESRKNATNESTKDDEHEEAKSIILDESGGREEKDVKNEKVEKTENFLTKIKSVHGPITNAISEQFSEDRPHDKYWTMKTKSSTVETVIEAVSPNTSMDEKTEIVADTPEIIAGESLDGKIDDVYSAVVKIQACTRGFLARRHMQKDLSSKLVSNNISSTQKTVSDHLMMPQDSANVREVRTGRQRLRREEALRNTTLSLENAFATGRLQHTGEFHDSVPLPLFDMTNIETDSTPSNESLSKEDEEDAEQAKESDVTKSNTNSDSAHDDGHGGIFQKRNAFTDHSFPIVMHLLADASRNCHFAVNQNSHTDFNANIGGAKLMEPAMDILMLGYPRDDDNRYLNFITSVEDLGSNMDSLPLDDAVKSSKNIDDARLSMTSGEGSLREPLALPSTPQGVVIEEVTSLDEIPSDSTKPDSSTAPRTSLDTNSSMPLEERALEDEKNDLGMSPTTVDVTGDRKHTNEEAARQNSDCNLENTSEVGHANKKSNEISREHVDGEKNDET